MDECADALALDEFVRVAYPGVADDGQARRQVFGNLRRRRGDLREGRLAERDADARAPEHARNLVCANGLDAEVSFTQTRAAQTRRRSCGVRRGQHSKERARPARAHGEEEARHLFEQVESRHRPCVHDLEALGLLYALCAVVAREVNAARDDFNLRRFGESSFGKPLAHALRQNDDAIRAPQADALKFLNRAERERPRAPQPCVLVLLREQTAHVEDRAAARERARRERHRHRHVRARVQYLNPFAPRESRREERAREYVERGRKE